MSKFDTEDILDLINSIMSSGGALNAKIAAIELEKGALTPTLAPIPSGGYYAQTWNDKILQTSPGVFYGIEEVLATGIGAAVAKTYRIFVEIVLTDSGLTNDGWRRIARYSRALEELFTSSFGAAAEVGTVKVDQVRPIAFKLELDSSDEVKVGGISLTMSLF